MANTKNTSNKFCLNKSRYDQSTFYGRLKHFLDITDPRTLFTSQGELDCSLKLLEAYSARKLPAGVTDEDLWRAQKIKQAMIHPDTNEKIFMPFRMSGFVPFGSPILVVGLLLPNQTFRQMIFWQWLNQTHNAGVNYANRNATKDTPTERFLMGYFGAVTSAVTIAVGLSFLIKKSSGLSPAKKLLIQKFVPFPAVATASTCNVLLMRNNELSTGIEVLDSNDNYVGTSKIAAERALLETAITRMFLPAPLLIIPPAIMAYLEKTKLLRRRPKLHLPFNAVITTLSFAFALPVAIALFPQTSTICTSKLEGDIQTATNETVLYYNKGL